MWKSPYIEAVEQAFGKDVDYAMLIKQYGTDPSEERRFIPPVVLSEEVRVATGNPDPERISTSYGDPPEPDDANGHAPLHPSHQRLLKEGRKPRCRHGHPLHVRIWTCEEIAALLD